MEDMIQDLAEHLAYHASIGYAECRDMDAADLKVPEVVDEGRTDGHDREFVVEHAGRKFTVTIEEVV